MDYRHKYSPGDLVENNHPCECPLDHSGMEIEENPTRVFRVKEAFFHEGHECLVLLGHRESRYYCSGTFRPVRPSTESINDMIKANKKQPVKEPA